MPATNQDTLKSQKKSLRSVMQKPFIYLKENKERLFWVWVIYQAIKGIITTSLIWIPLLYAALN